MRSFPAKFAAACLISIMTTPAWAASLQVNDIAVRNCVPVQGWQVTANSVAPSGSENLFASDGLLPPIVSNDLPPMPNESALVLSSGDAVMPSNSGSAPAAAKEKMDVTDAATITPTSNGKTEKAPLGKKLISVVAAFCVGTPVCVVRRSKYEEKYAVNQMVGDTDKKFVKKLAAAFWLPFSIVDGTLEAPFDAAANGLMYSNKPFSKDQMSCGKLIQNN